MSFAFPSLPIRFISSWSDIVIMLILGAIPLLILFLFSRRKKTGNKGPGTPVLTCILVFVWLTIFWGSFIQPRMLAVKPYAITIDKGTRQLRVVVVSDLHLGIYKGGEWTEKVVQRITALNPDLVIIAGDSVSNDAGLEALEPLKNLRAKFGVYNVLGNWDYRIGAVDVRKRLGSYGVKTLVNRSVPIDIPGAPPIRLVGMDDYWFGKPDWKKAMSEVPKNAITLVAVHNPDIIEEAELNSVDLLIAGHTHGGQVRLPWVGAVPLISLVHGNRFDQGIFSVGQTKLFITPGVGESGARARLFSTPEISLVTISL